MKLEVFAVHDSAVGAYLQPFFARSKAEAIRSFSDAVNNEKGAFSAHALDFTLCYLGSFDDSSAAFDPCAVVRLLGAAEIKIGAEEEAPVKPPPVRRVPM